MKSLLMVMTVLVVASAREWKSAGYNIGYYWDRGCDFFRSEGYDLSPFVTLTEPWECAKRCVDNPRCTHFHHDFDHDRQQFLCYHKRNTEYKPEVSRYSGATCGWIPGRSNYDLHYTDSKRSTRNTQRIINQSIYLTR